MGFLVAIIWIMAIADEVVNVLQVRPVLGYLPSISFLLSRSFFSFRFFVQTFGRIFGLSDAIIGLTIFAVGNSLADLVANTAVAVSPPFPTLSEHHLMG
jgi:sodium/potassium/calcium exchanger 6